MEYWFLLLETIHVIQSQAWMRSGLYQWAFTRSSVLRLLWSVKELLASWSGRWWDTLDMPALLCRWRIQHMPVHWHLVYQWLSDVLEGHGPFSWCWIARRIFQGSLYRKAFVCDIYNMTCLCEWDSLSLLQFHKHTGCFLRSSQQNKFQLQTFLLCMHVAHQILYE